jgi:hypothetical protein
MLIILDNQEEKIRRSMFLSQPRQIVHNTLVSKIAKRWLVEWFKWYSACPASMRPCVQIPVPQKREKYQVIRWLSE